MLVPHGTSRSLGARLRPRYWVAGLALAAVVALGAVGFWIHRGANRYAHYGNERRDRYTGQVCVWVNDVGWVDRSSGLLCPD